MRALRSLASSTTVVLALAGCSAVAREPASEPQRSPEHVVVDDGQRGHDLEQFSFAGRWERVQHLEDGRSDGTSTRSRWPGSVAILTFRGRRVWLYGVRGRNGGTARLSVDASKPSRDVSFAASRKIAHSLIYESKEMPAGFHFLAIGVVGRRYVNIDDVEIER